MLWLALAYFFFFFFFDSCCQPCACARDLVLELPEMQDHWGDDVQIAFLVDSRAFQVLLALLDVFQCKADSVLEGEWVQICCFATVRGKRHQCNNKPQDYNCRALLPHPWNAGRHERKKKEGEGDERGRRREREGDERDERGGREVRVGEKGERAR